MNAIEVPYLPISNFKEADVCDKYSESPSDEMKDSIVAVDENLLFSEKNELSSEVAFILHGIGMEKYVEVFQKGDVDLDTFLQLNDSDLQELGITDSEDKRTILENIEIHQTTMKESIVEEKCADFYTYYLRRRSVRLDHLKKFFYSHLEDLKIAKNVFHQLLLVQNYCAYVDLQLKKHKLTDYKVGWQESASDYLIAFTKCTVTQSKILSNSLFNESKSDHLIGKVLEINNLTLPNHLQEKLKSCGKNRKSHILGVMVLIGFCSLVLLTGKNLIRRW